MSPVRVLWVIKGLGPGGAERLLCAQARVHDNNRFSIECAYVLAKKDHLADELERAGVRTTCVSQTARDLWWPKRLVDLIRNGDWGVIHVHSPLPAIVARLAVMSMSRSRRPAIVSTEHNRWETFHSVTRVLNAITSRFDSVTLAVSDEVARSMTGPAGRRVQVLRHGIDIDRVSAARSAHQEMRAELGIGPDEFVVGTVANFRPQKDYPNLLGAAKIVADEGAAIRFVAVGQGPGEEEAHRLRSQLGLEPTVLFTGFRDDAVQVMAACDVFVLASQWEGLPVAVMEACALGLPIVATKVGGLAEEFVDGETALLVPPRDSGALAKAIQQVHADGALRGRLSLASTTNAARFDVYRTGTFLEDLYCRYAKSRSSEPTPTTSVPTSTRTRRVSDDITIRPASMSDRPGIIELCRASLGWSDDPCFEELFAWKHDQNPFGPSVVLVAEKVGHIIGLRTFMRWEFERGGKILHAVRAVDTATHPDFQGRGLFTTMTLAGLDQLRKDGINFVFNTPNDKSRPGYVKMGWQEVGRISIAARVVRPDSIPRLINARVEASFWPEVTSAGVPVGEALDQLIAIVELDRRSATKNDVRAITTHVTSDFLRWRYEPGHIGARLFFDGSGVVVVVARRRGDAIECSLLDSFALSREQADRRAVEAAREIGADYVVRPGKASISTGFVPVPGFGPRLTWRNVDETARPPLANWKLTLGTIASF